MWRNVSCAIVRIMCLAGAVFLCWLDVTHPGFWGNTRAHFTPDHGTICGLSDILGEGDVLSQVVTVFTDDLVKLHLACIRSGANIHAWMQLSRARKKLGEKMGYPASIVRTHQVRSTFWVGSLLHMLWCLGMSCSRMRRARAVPVQPKVAVYRVLSEYEDREMMRAQLARNMERRRLQNAARAELLARSVVCDS